MRTMHRHLGALLAPAALVAAAAAAFAGVLAVGDEAPDLALAMADGTEQKLSAHEGKTVVLFFYGTWQKRAAEEAAAVGALRKGREKQALVLIGVARDATAADAKKFAEDAKLSFPQAADPKGDLYKRFAEKGLPYVVVLDGKRKVKHSAAGADTAAVGKVLTNLLGKPEGDAPSSDGKSGDGMGGDGKGDRKGRDDDPGGGRKRDAK